MDKNSKSTKMLKLANRKGYRVKDGIVTTANGRIRKLAVRGSGNRPKYKVFNISDPEGTSYPILVHQLMAYQKFGDDIFNHDTVRHLDGNSLNNLEDNIALGSHSDNAMDRPEQERKDHAKKAAESRLRDDWNAIEKDYETMSFKKISKKYGVSTGTLSHHFNNIKGWEPKHLTVNNKINQEIADEIRAVSGLNNKQIALKYGISDSLVGKIRNNKRWVRL